MHIAITGKETATETLLPGPSSGVNITKISGHDIAHSNLHEYDAVFDLDFDEQPARISHYSAQTGPFYFLGTASINLEETAWRHGVPPSDRLIGFNNLPGLMKRNVLEACDPWGTDRVKAGEILNSLGFDGAEWVASRVGLVTPRVICMIINEAFYTVQEGTASREDIDQAMKLGTNYPKGPFEWCREIGIDKVYNLLRAVYKDTGEERYKVCPLLKSEYLHARLLPKP